MKNGYHPIFLALMLLTVSALAGIEKIEDSGAYLELDDVLPYDEPAVVLFYVGWEQDSIDLMADVEYWAGQYPDLAILFVDCASVGSAVYNQFAMSKIPSMLIFDEKQKQVGDFLFEVSDLEKRLKDNNLLP
ncbi:MAG: hypothetical protein ACO3ZG_06465 [Kiritimatiellia bacterium]